MPWCLLTKHGWPDNEGSEGGVVVGVTFCQSGWHVNQVESMAGRSLFLWTHLTWLGLATVGRL
jgi:hypothetical protein